MLHCSNGSDEICAQLVDRARIGAPVPVAATVPTPTLGTLRVTATFGPADGPLMLTLGADRPVPMDDAQGSLLPRRFVATDGETPIQFIDRALDAFLPWRGRRGPGRMISIPKGEISR